MKGKSVVIDTLINYIWNCSFLLQKMGIISKMVIIMEL